VVSSSILYNIYTYLLIFLATDYNSLLGARIMQGFGTGPFEMLVPSSIGDMFDSFTFSALIWLGTLFISEGNGLLFKQCQCLVWLF
jgi:MFS family permease